MALAFVCAAGASAGCPNGPAAPDDCTDGLDNDGDGSIDGADPGCTFNQGRSETPDPMTYACDDDTDNDGDGLIDYPDDPGCTGLEDNSERNEPIAQCDDGRDNDSDGFIDYPNDPGCFSPFSNNESDTCPLGARCPACGNGIDDDGDGQADYPADLGCDTASDDDEFNADVTNCGAGVAITPLALGTEAMGAAEAEGANQLVSPSCGGLGAETVYRLELAEAAILVVTTSFPETTLDTVVYLRSVCRDIATELACNDDGQDLSSNIQVAVTAGTYFLVVDAHHQTSSGEFRVRVDSYLPEGEMCDPMMPECAPGHVCRPVDDNTTMPTCELPACMDGLDNDFDGTIDYPGEPGCDSLTDNDEHDDCPSGPNCPECGNGVDDDGDGLSDYPDDLGCEAASDDVEVNCTDEQDIIGIIDAGTVSGVTSGGSNDFSPSCSPAGSAPDRVHALNVTSPLVSLHVDTIGAGFDTVLSIKTPTCDVADLACDDNGVGVHSRIDLGAVAPGPYLILVDGSFSDSGPYDLHVHGVIAAGAACDPALEASGLYSCENGYACDGATCVLAQCNNLVDDDADGLIDVAEDPGCAGASDDDEFDDCPMGPGCAECSNGIDDDTDGLIDYPADMGCLFPGDDTEQDCNEESDPVDALTAGTVFGSTAAATHDFTPSCAATNSAPDQAFALVVNAPLLSLSVDTIGSGFDTMLSIKTPTCGDPDIACDDDGGTGASSRIDLTGVAPGAYFIIVDGYSSSSGAFVLNTHGVIAGGGVCDPALITSGLFSCETGYACDGAVCAPAACSNGMDDDGDGVTDYPGDPGCESISDGDESDDCPMGPSCPACSNAMDDDGDGVIDYPNDPGCASANDADEQDCQDSDPLLPVTSSTAMGSTIGATDDFTPSCGFSSGAPDHVYVLDIPGTLDTLDLDTNGSTYDTMLYVKQPECVSADLACDDDGGMATQSAISLTSVMPGLLFIFVDGYAANAGSYTLHVSGVIGAGQPCDLGQISAGIFTCAAGTMCVDPGGGFVCQ